jgi:sortase A
MRFAGRALELGLAGVGCLLLAVVGETLLETRLRDHLGTRRLARIAERPVAASSSAPEQPQERHETGSLLGRLEIPRLGVSSIIVEGAEGELRTAIGHLPQSAPLGGDGNSAVAGHRDTIFRPLKDVREGDRVEVTTWRGVFTYEVTGTRVVEADAMEVVAPSPEPVLTLITCYPFSYFGRAPQRFVVHARRVEARSAASPDKVSI